MTLRPALCSRVTSPLPDAAADNWVDRHAPLAWRPWLKLGRLDRPTGIWLLMLPGWQGIALSSAIDGVWPDPVLLAKFAAFAALGLVINVGVTVVFSHMLELMPVLTRSPLAHYLPVLAKVGGIGTAFIFNFAVNTLVVFRART